jgi:chloramphenicol 3-O phosphotransferase
LALPVASFELRDDAWVGMVVMLNGVPRSGKSSIATAMIDADPHSWVNVGVDDAIARTPPGLRPGIGLRPGDDRPDVRAMVPALYDELWARVDQAAIATNVIVDVGLYDLRMVRRCGEVLAHHDLRWVKVWCPLETVLERRRNSAGYVAASLDSADAAPIRAWHEAVYALPLGYDVEVDTAGTTPSDLAEVIRSGLAKPESDDGGA